MVQMNCLPAEVVVHLVHANSIVLTGCVHLTLIDICFTLEACKARLTFASVLRNPVLALCSVLAGIGGTLVYIDLTLRAVETVRAMAEVTTGVCI